MAALAVLADMKKKKPVPSKKFWYVQPWGTYCNDTVVCVGMSKSDIAAVIARFEKEYSSLAGIGKEFDEMVGHDLTANKGYVFKWKGRTVLVLRPFVDDWAYWETLIHETHHLVQMILGEDKGMKDEIEGLAYQQEFLFSEIRRRLQSRFGVVRKTRKGK